jgi:hypothetical protein
MLGAMLLAFASCFFAPERPGGGQSGGADAAFDSAVKVDMLSGDAIMGSGNCPSDEMGPSPDPCGTWGNQSLTGGGTIARSGGVLEAKVGSFGDSAACTTPVDIDFSHGVSIDLQQPLQGGSGDTTSFTAAFDQNGFMKIETKQTTSLQITASCSGPGGFSNAATWSSAFRYLKIAPSSGTSTVAASYSANGSSWTTMGSCSLTGNNLALASVRFGATAGSGSFTTRAAVFDSFKTCTTP